LSFLQLLAQVTTQPAKQPLPWYLDPSQMLFPLLGIFFIFIIFSSSRTKKNEAKLRDDMLKNMKRGDRVMTAGGILGTVVDVRDADVVLKVDESTNTKIKFTRDAIKRVLADDDTPAKL
jgi:preprotein translocase subunit YajC